MVEILGIIAGCFTTLSFIPQVIKVIKTKDTESISLLMYSLFTCGVLLWLVYGFLIGSLSIIAANAVTLPLAIIILWYKVRGSFKS
jgi:MtN3 and saliva related transmembrane protein